MRFRRERKHKVRASIDLTPAIDVVFLLLLFFMLSSTFVVQTSIPIEQPVAEGTGNIENRDLTVTLTYGTAGPDGGGEVFVNDRAMASWAELTAVLAAFHQDKPDGLMLIRPDARVATERLVRVLGIANSLGMRRYAIAARPPGEAE